MRHIVIALACLIAVATTASAQPADQPIAGDSHIVIAGTLVKMSAKSDDAFPLPAGDPTKDGGQLVITDTGGGSPPMIVDLPADGWRRFGNKHKSPSYMYKGAGTADDPCVSVMVTSKNISFVCIGAGVTLDPPFTGTSAISLIVDGTRYCAEFGGRTQKNNDHQLRRRNAPAPASCAGGGGGTTSTTTPGPTTSSTTTPTPTTSSTTTATPTTSSTTTPTPTTSSTTTPTPTTSSTTTATPTTSSTTTATPTTSSTTTPTPTTSSTTTPTPTTSSTTTPTPTTSSTTAQPTTTSTSSTTSTTAAQQLCCNGATAVSFLTADQPGDCGDILDSMGVLVTNLACSGLYTGGGGNSVPLPFAVPDRGFAINAITACTGQNATLGATTSAQTGSNRTCTAPGCLFGAPLAVPNPGSTPTSVCTINSIGGTANGMLACDTGATTLDLPLSSVLYLTGDTATDPMSTIAGIQPCPVCLGGNPGTCVGGTNTGNSCIPGTSPLNPSYPTSHDCPPDPMFNIGTLPIAFGLTSGTLVWTGTPATNDTGSTSSVQNRVFSGFCRNAEGTGAFAGSSPATAQECWRNGQPVGPPCSGGFESCEQRNNGAFGPNGGANKTIIAIGNAMSILSGSAPATLVSIFTIPPTFDPTVDSAGDLPGPGAVSLPGTATLCSTVASCPAP